MPACTAKLSHTMPSAQVFTGKPLYEKPETLENDQRPDPGNMGDLHRARWQQHSCTFCYL